MYSDDVYKIAELLKKQKDFTLIKEKDYIKNPKKSGYKKKPEEMKKAEADLKNYSAVISRMDEQMLELRKKVEKM